MYYRVVSIENTFYIVTHKPRSHTIIELSAIPNPTVNYFNLRIKSPNKAVAEIRVYDMTGKVVETARGNPLENYRLGEGLVNGMYLVEVIQENVRATIKVVKGN